MSRYRVFLAVNVSAFLLMIGVGMIVALLPLRVMDLTGSFNNVSYIASAFAVSYLAVQMPVGGMADRFGAKPFLIAGYGLCGLSGVLFAVAASADGVFLGRLVQGAGEAPIWALGPALLSIAYPAAKGRAIGFYNASIHLGLAAGPLLGVFVLPSAQGQTPFLVFAGLCLMGALLVLVFLPADTRTPDRFSRSFHMSDFLGLMRNRDCAATLFGVLLFGAGYGSFISVVPGYLAAAKGLDHFGISLIFTLFYVAIGVSQLVAGPLSDRYGRHAFMIGGMATACIGIAAIVIVPKSLVHLPVTLASLGLGVFCVASMTFVNERVPRHMKATVTGAFYMFWGGGYFAGPLLVDWSSSLAGLDGAHYMLAASMGISVLLQIVALLRRAAGD